MCSATASSEWHNTKHKDKAELINNLFADQCSLIKNSSVLTSVLFKPTENVISSINFSSDDIAKIVQKLDPNRDPNKAHGHVMIPTQMLKIYVTLSTSHFS